MTLTFAEKLKEIRTERGLNIRELAKALNINYTLISMLESGKRQPSSDVIEKVANYTGLDRRYLEFLSFPIPVEYKRIISESHNAPDFVKAQSNQDVDVVDKLEQLIGLLFRDIETRLAPWNREYYTRLTTDLKAYAQDPKVHTWARHYETRLGYDR